MEDLQPRPIPQQPAAPVPPAPEVTTDIDDATRQEEARTIRYAIGKLNDFLQWFIGVMEITLLIRFLLKLIGADKFNPFAGFLYALTDIILYPFSSIIPARELGGLPVLEGSTLIAMGIYWLIFWAVRRFLQILITSPDEPAS